MPPAPLVVAVRVAVALVPLSAVPALAAVSEPAEPASRQSPPAAAVVVAGQPQPVASRNRHHTRTHNCGTSCGDTPPADAGGTWVQVAGSSDYRNRRRIHRSHRSNHTRHTRHDQLQY